MGGRGRAAVGGVGPLTLPPVMSEGLIRRPIFSISHTGGSPTEQARHFIGWVL